MPQHRNPIDICTTSIVGERVTVETLCLGLLAASKDCLGIIPLLGFNSGTQEDDDLMMAQYNIR